MTLILPHMLQARIEALALSAFPAECCGLMEGISRGATMEVLALHPARNIAPGRWMARRFPTIAKNKV